MKIEANNSDSNKFFPKGTTMSFTLGLNIVWKRSTDSCHHQDFRFIGKNL